MDGDSNFSQIRIVFEAIVGEFKQARADADSSERMIASAEYELELLKQDFAASRLPD